MNEISSCFYFSCLLGNILCVAYYNQHSFVWRGRRAFIFKTTVWERQVAFVLTAVCDACDIGRVSGESRSTFPCKSDRSRQVQPPQAVNYLHLFKVNLFVDILWMWWLKNARRKPACGLTCMFTSTSSYLGAHLRLSLGKCPTNGMLSLRRDFQ